MTLARLLEQATTKPPYPAEEFPREWSEYARAVVMLNQFAPDMARLLIDAMELMDRTTRGDWELDEMWALLARFAELNARAGADGA